jgi:SAM-dependent methyltransferase
LYAPSTMPRPVPQTEGRTQDELRRHYEIEKELAGRLRAANTDERRTLYTALYNELLTRVPGHPLLTTNVDPEASAGIVTAQLRMLEQFIRPGLTFLEIGAGDCALSLALAPRVARVYALDVSEEIVRDVSMPANGDLLISDGVDIPLDDHTVDLAYSNQLMEHLHPDDAQAQLENIRRVLKRGSAYVCITPNRLTGPHDISGYFDDVPTGFHLQEYDVGSIRRTFRQAGFESVRVLVGARGRFTVVPPWPIIALEAGLARLGAETRREVARRLRLNALLGIRVVARTR